MRKKAGKNQVTSVDEIAKKWQSWNLNSGIGTAEPILLITMICLSFGCDDLFEIMEAAIEQVDHL